MKRDIIATPTNFWGRVQRWYQVFKENIGEEAPNQGENYCPVFWAAVLTFFAEGGFVTESRLIRYGYLIIIPLYMAIGMPTYTLGIEGSVWLTGLFMLVWSMGSAYLYKWLIETEFLDVFVDNTTTLDKVYTRAMLVLLFASPVIGFILCIIVTVIAATMWISYQLAKIGLHDVEKTANTIIWLGVAVYIVRIVVRLAQTELSLQESKEALLVLGGAILALAIVVLVVYLLIRFFLFLNRKSGFGAGVKRYALKWYKDHCPKWRFVAK